MVMRFWKQRPTGYEVVQTLLGLVMLLAAGLKGYQLATEPTAELGLLTSRWFLIAAVEFEWAFGLWMVAGLYPTRTRIAAIGCFATFACIALAKGLSGAPSCGCFGSIEVNPWNAMVLDALAVAALWLWKPTGGSLPVCPLASVRIAAVVVAWLLLGIPGALAMGGYSPAYISPEGMIVGEGDVVVLEPESWVGKPLPLLKHIDIGEELAVGDWLVVLYRHDCSRCEAAIPEYSRTARQLAEGSGGVRLALVELPPYGDTANRFTLEVSPCAAGQLTRKKEWFVEVPVEIALRDGRVSCVSIPRTRSAERQAFSDSKGW